VEGPRGIQGWGDEGESRVEPVELGHVFVEGIRMKGLVLGSKGDGEDVGVMKTRRCEEPKKKSKRRKRGEAAILT
jgi:hypothetical protein